VGPSWAAQLFRICFFIPVGKAVLRENLAAVRAGGLRWLPRGGWVADPAPAGEIPGISLDMAAAIIAGTGLDMTRFPAPGHLVSRAGLCPRTRQSGPRTRAGKKGQGNTYLRGYPGQAATGAAGTATFLGERHGRIARRRGRAKAQVAIARSILVIIWHLLAGPQDRFTDLGPDYYASRTDKDKKIRNHIRQLQAPGMDVTIAPAA